MGGGGGCTYYTSFYCGETRKIHRFEGKIIGFQTLSGPSPTRHLHPASRKRQGWNEKQPGCNGPVLSLGCTLESLERFTKTLLGLTLRDWIELVWGTDWILVLKIKTK